MSDLESLEGVGDSLSFEALLRSAREGDAEAVGALHARFAGIVLARIRARLSRDLRVHYDSTDIAQSVVIELLRHLDGFDDRGEAAFRHWLYTVAENKIRHKLRRLRDATGRRREVGISDDVARRARSEDDGPITSAGKEEERARVRDLVGQVDEQSRDLIRMRIDEGLSFAAIAVRLDLPSADAARMRFTRAMARLRDRWDDAEPARGLTPPEKSLRSPVRSRDTSALDAVEALVWGDGVFPREGVQVRVVPRRGGEDRRRARTPTTWSPGRDDGRTLMRNRTKVALATIGLVASAGFTIDAYATTLNSPQGVEYFAVTLSGGQQMALPPGSSATILIDDLTFVEGAEEICGAEMTCAIWEPPPGSEQLPGLGTGSFFADLVGAGGAAISMSQATQFGGMMTVTSSMSDLRSGSSSVGWSHGVTLGDYDGTNPIAGIDEFTLKGGAFWVLRETSVSGMFAMADVDVFGLDHAGFGGAGAGVGTGVGAGGWLTPTTQSRHYQTPYIVRGDRVVCSSTSLTGSRVHIKGRIITDPTLAPTVNQSLIVSTAN